MLRVVEKVRWSMLELALVYPCGFGGVLFRPRDRNAKVKKMAGARGEIDLGGGGASVVHAHDGGAVIGGDGRGVSGERCRPSLEPVRCESCRLWDRR